MTEQEVVALCLVSGAAFFLLKRAFRLGKRQRKQPDNITTSTRLQRGLHQAHQNRGGKHQDT